jgi:hypothetical protein
MKKKKVGTKGYVSVFISLAMKLINPVLLNDLTTAKPF